MMKTIAIILLSLLIAAGFTVIGFIAYGWAGVVFAGVSAVVCVVVLWRKWDSY
jgi:hypothetical protein